MFIAFMWPAMSEVRRGSSSPARYSKNPSPSGMSHRPWCSSLVRPDAMNVGRRKTSPGMVMAP